MATNYQRGRGFEYRCKEALENAGYYVTRSASSQGVADLVAIGHGVTLLVQCKLNCQPTMSELQDLYQVSEEFGGWPVIAQAPNRGPISWYTFGPNGLYELTTVQLSDRESYEDSSMRDPQRAQAALQQGEKS